MSRAMLRRLENLEQRTCEGKDPVHCLLGTAETLDQQEADLKAAAKWKEGDKVFRIELVPGALETELRHEPSDAEAAGELGAEG